MTDISLDDDQLGHAADYCMMSSVMGARMIASKLQQAWQARMAPGAEPSPLGLSEDEYATAALACASVNEPDSRALAELFAANAGDGFELPPPPSPMADDPPSTEQPAAGPDPDLA